MPGEVCTCGRRAITVFTGSIMGDVPWCGTNGLPPLPGSKQAAEMEAEQTPDPLVCFAPDTATAMRLTVRLDEAADRLVGAEAARDACAIERDEESLELAESCGWADGALHGLAEALGLLVGRDPLTLRTEAYDRAVGRRATARERLAARVGSDL